MGASSWTEDTADMKETRDRRKQTVDKEQNAEDSTEQHETIGDQGQQKATRNKSR